jgi:hypothetical protein
MRLQLLIIIIILVCFTTNALAIKIDKAPSKPVETSNVNSDMSNVYIDRSEYYKSVIGSNEYNKLSKLDKNAMSKLIDRIDKYSPAIVHILNKYKESSCITGSNSDVNVTTDDEMLTCSIYKDAVEYTKALSGNPSSKVPIDNFDSYFAGIDKWLDAIYNSNKNNNKTLEFKVVEAKNVIMILSKYIDSHESTLSAALNKTNKRTKKPEAPLPSNK